MFILQMTGLSGAGKTTLAYALKESLTGLGITVEVIDADEYRKTLCRDLGFSAADRRENIRRLGRLAHQFAANGVLPVIAAINPYEDIRAELRELYGARTIWIRCAPELLLQRDTKGLYRKAMLPDDDPQKIRNLSGINDPYEEPVSAELVIDTGQEDPEASRQRLLDFVVTLQGWKVS